MALSMKIHLRNKQLGRIWPSDEIPQERTRKSPEEDADIERVGTELDEVYDSQEDFREIPVVLGEDMRDYNDSDSYDEIDLKSSITSRTIVDLTLSLCKMSTTPSSNLVYASASEQPNRTEFDATQSLNHIHHVTEVVTADLEGPEMSVAEITVSSIQDDEHLPRVAEEIPAPSPRRKCTSWYCPHGKNPLQLASLVLLYLVLGVIFFPFLLIVFMVCCVSFFTPDID